MAGALYHFVTEFLNSECCSSFTFSVIHTVTDHSIHCLIPRRAQLDVVATCMEAIPDKLFHTSDLVTKIQFLKRPKVQT